MDLDYLARTYLSSDLFEDVEEGVKALTTLLEIYLKLAEKLDKLAECEDYQDLDEYLQVHHKLWFIRREIEDFTGGHTPEFILKLC